MKKLIMVGLILMFVLLGPAASVLNACRCPIAQPGYVLDSFTCIQDIYGCTCSCTYVYEP